MRNCSSADAAGYAGVVDAVLGPDGLVRLYASGSQRVLRALPDERGAWRIWAVGQSPGLKGGDRQRIRLTVAAGARGIWEPVAAEQVLPGMGRWAVSTVELTVGAGGRLLWAARPTIPHGGARLRRRVRVRAADDAWVALEEWATAGRIGAGERWDDIAWDWVTDVAWGARRWRDRVRAADAGAADGAEAVWSLWLLAAPRLGTELEARLSATRDVYAACLPLAPGAVLGRALGSAAAIAALADGIRAWLRPRMLDGGRKALPAEGLSEADGELGEEAGMRAGTRVGSSAAAVRPDAVPSPGPRGTGGR